MNISAKQAYADYGIVINSPFSSGDGSAESPFIIEFPAQLSSLSELVNNGGVTESGQMYSSLSYKLSNDLDMNNQIFTPIGFKGIENGSTDIFVIVTSLILDTPSLQYFWTNPETGEDIYNQYFYTYDELNGYTSCAGKEYNEINFPNGTDFYFLYTFERAFFGTFDGNGHTIENLTIPNQTVNAGLFGYAVNAVIKNITLKNSSITSSNSVGTVVGEASSSSISNCNIINSYLSASDENAVGGVVGLASTKIKYSAPLGDYVRENIDNFLFPKYAPEPQNPTIKNCTVVGGEYSASISGGIVGKSQYISVSDCIASVTADGAIIGSIDASTYVTKCISDGLSPLFGTIFSDYENCYYPNDILNDTNIPSYYTTEELVSLGKDALFLDTWTDKAPNSTTYYYPSPTNVFISVTAYTVKIDDEKTAFVNSLSSTSFQYTLPIIEKPGLSFAYFYIDDTQKQAGDILIVDSDKNILTYWTIIPATHNDIVLLHGKDYSAEYNGISRILEEITFTSVLEYSFQWYSSENKIDFILCEEKNTSTLTFSNAKDSAYYKCRITLNAPNKINIAENSPVFIDSPIYYYSISPKVVEIELSALLDEINYTTYTGNIILPTLTYTDNGILENDKTSIEVKYDFKIGNIPFEEIISVGEYTISATLIQSNYDFSVTDCSFTVLPASITCASSPFSGTYDGNPHTISISDINTVDDCSYTIEYADSYLEYTSSPIFQTNVVTDFTVFVRIKAPNHSDYLFSDKINIFPISVSLATKTNYPLISKVFDESLIFPVNSITKNHYTASYSGEFSGICPIVITSVLADSSNVGNVNISANFKINSVNFSLTNTFLSFSGEITTATITITPLKAVKGIYNGNIDFTGLISDSIYSISTDSGATPAVAVQSAEANSKNVNEATFLTVSFMVSGKNFIFSNANGKYKFDFSLSPKKLSFKTDTDYLYAKNRDYDGTVEVDLFCKANALLGIIIPDTPSLIIGKGIISSPNVSETPYSVSIPTIGLDSNNYYLESIPIVTVLITKATPIINPYVSNNNLFTSSNSLPSLNFLENDTLGTADWTVSFLSSGLIDFGQYTVYDENKVNLPFTFTPNDKANYISLDSFYTFIINDVITSDIAVVYKGKTVFNAFEKINISELKVEGIRNDGSTFSIKYGRNGFSIVYPNNKTYFHAGDTFFQILYLSDSSIPITKSQSVTVNKIMLTVPSSQQAYSYNQQLRTFIPINYNPDLMSISNNTAIDAGTYTARVTLLAETIINYQFQDLNQNYCDIEWSISPIKKYYPFLDISTYIFSGEEISPEIRNDFNTTSDFFSLSGNLSETNAGLYNITVSLISNNYYWAETNDSLPITLGWEIEKCVIAIPQIYNLPFIYDGQAHSVTSDTNLAYSLSGDLNYTDAGDYSITAELFDNKNYVWNDDSSDLKKLDYSVAKMEVLKPHYSGTPVFNGKVHFIRIENNDYYNVTGTTRAINADYYSATVSLKDKNNYIWNDETKDDFVILWRISPLSIEKPILLGTNIYTSREQNALITTDSNYVTLSGNIQTNANNYKATASLKDKHNTLWKDGTTEDVTIDWLILPLSVKTPASPVNAIYNGLTITASIPISDLYTITNNKQSKAGVYKITVSLKDKANCIWENNTTEDLNFDWKICSLSFINGDNILNANTYILGTSLPSPYLDGYQFDGWYLSSDFSGEKITVLEIIDEDTTLYAKYIEKSKTEFKDKEKSSVLSEKAIIGLTLGGSAIVIAVAIVLIGLFIKNEGVKSKKTKTNHPSDMI